MTARIIKKRKAMQNAIKGVTPAKAGAQKLLKKLDSRTSDLA